MAKQAAAPRIPSSYDLMSNRIQRIINATGAQASKRALIYRAANESEDDWMQLLNAIDEADNVTLTNRDDEGVEVSWVVPKED